MWAVRAGYFGQRTQSTGHIDDAAIAVRHHDPDAGLGQQKGAGGIGVESVVKNYGVTLEDAGLRIDHDAGIVDQ